MLQAQIGAAAPPLTLEPPLAIAEAHRQRIVQQLERQALTNDGMVRRCAVQAAQLSILGGIADALAKSSDVEHAIDDMLVVWNLAANGVKLAPRGGAVAVRLARRDARVQIAVSDTGQGIERDFLPHVFDRFRQADSSTTRAHGGLGLGLWIVRHLVGLHGERSRPRATARGAARRSP